MPEDLNPDEALRAYWAARSRRRSNSPGLFATVADFFMFRRMLTPWILRFGFGFFAGVMCFLVLLSVFAAFKATTSGNGNPPTDPLAGVGQAISGQVATGVSAMAAVVFGILGAILITVIVRIAFEIYIVLFQINETLSDIREQLSNRGTGR
jgi:hypothetical protein